VTAEQAPADESLRTTLLRNLGGATALVVLVAVAFWGVGQASEPGATEVAGAPTDQEPEEPEAPEEPEEVEEAEPEEAEPEEPEAPDEQEEAEEAEPEEAEESPEPDEPDGDEQESDEADESDDEADEDAARFDPGEISVQVLDGVGTDGGAAANRVGGELRDAGFNVIAQNPAIAYDVTTVLWTSGNEDRARQVAAEIGASEVRQQPGNLSEQPDVHVVVGADRA
jgi:type IV secretory pathway VirB10-like protein